MKTPEEITQTAGTPKQDCCFDPKMKIFGNVIVWAKGQIVIPKEVRDMLNIQPGDSLVVTTKHDLAIGIIKGTEVVKFMEYIHKELDEISSKVK